MYDFPANPTEDQEYTPPVGGQTYIYKAPRWLVKGVPPTGGGGGGGIADAPVDGKQYARKDATWSQVIIPSTDWASISGKPVTFPPTLPIAWADVSGKPATYPPTLPIGWTDVSGKPATYPPTVPIAWTDVSGKPTTYPPTVPIAWTDVSGKPATYPPTLPILETDVTNLTTDLAAKAPLASPSFTGNPTAPTPAVNDADTSIATTAFVTAAIAADVTPWAEITGKPATFPPTVPIDWVNVSNKPATYPPTLPIAESGVTNLVTDLAAKEPTIAAGTAAQFWRGDKSWQTVPASDWGAITGKPATFPPTLPIAQSGVTNLVEDLAAKEPAITNGTTSQFWRGDKTWQIIDVGGSTSINDYAPASPKVGQLWYESDTGNTYIWYDDGNTQQWVQQNTGVTGAAGPANQLSIGTVTTGAPGGAAGATITGASPTQILNLDIPQGIQGIQGVQGLIAEAPTDGMQYARQSSAWSSVLPLIFPVTQVVSSNPNAFDDCEKGAFTAVISGSTAAGAGTYSVQASEYTKIGRIVHVRFNVTWSAHTGTGTMRLGGLPFVVSGETAGSMFYSGLTYTSAPTLLLRHNTSYAECQQAATNAANAAIAIEAAGAVWFSAVYIASGG